MDLAQDAFLKRPKRLALVDMAKKKILLVEDEEKLRANLAEKLPGGRLRCRKRVRR